jgi:hypothetical protein
MGMANCAIGVYPNSKSFNGISLWLTIPKKNDINKLYPRLPKSSDLSIC